MYQLSPKSPKIIDKEHISKEIKTYIAPDDVIASLLCFCKKKEINSNSRVLHSSIKKLKDDYPEQFEDFIFSRGDIYPFSRDLETVLFRLELSGILKTDSDFKNYKISPYTKKEIRKVILPKFSKDRQDRLKKISARFENYLSEINHRYKNFS